MDLQTALQKLITTKFRSLQKSEAQEIRAIILADTDTDAASLTPPPGLSRATIARLARSMHASADARDCEEQIRYLAARQLTQPSSTADLAKIRDILADDRFGAR